MVTRRRRRVADAAEREIARVREWQAAEDKPLAARVDYLEGLLARFALAERAAGRGKTLSTPYARVATYPAGGGWLVTEEAVGWARQNRPELVQVVESLQVAAAKHTLRVADGKVIDPRSGDLVPGIAVAPIRLVATVTLIGDQ
jgi:hypothetical protein